MENKAHLIMILKDEFNQWEEFLTNTPEETIPTINLLDDMTIKDVVAHLTVWQRISVERLEAAREEREPMYPNWHPEFEPESPGELDRINAWIFASNQLRPWGDVYHEWTERYLDFIKLAENIPEEDLLDKDKYPWLRGYALADVLLGSYEHHREHLNELIK